VPTLDDLLDEIDRFAVGLDEAAADAVNHGAFIFKTHLQAGISRSVGSDMEYSEGGGIPVNVRYRLNGNGPARVAKIYPVGPVHWLRGTGPHDIAPRRKKALALGNRTNDDEVTSRRVRHPGSRDRSTWRRDKQAAAPDAAEAMAGYFRDLVRG
jgi:hypothetical protein